MQDTELFQRFVEKRFKGQSLDTTTGHLNVHLFNTSVASFKHHIGFTNGAVNTLDRNFQVIPGFIETMKPNAVADYLYDRHFAGMHSSLFVAVNEFAMFCFTQSDFFPEIGNPSAENNPQPEEGKAPGLWLIERTGQGHKVQEEHSQKLTPRDDERYNASIHLALLMARFVWLHEFAHCFNGHVDYVQDKGLALFLCELPVVGYADDTPENTDNELNESETLQCLEFDADQSAFWTSCQVQISERENIEGILNYDLQTRLRLTLFGCYAMTWLFEEFLKHSGTEDADTHPKPYFRLQNLFRTAASNISPLVPEFSALNYYVCQQFDALKGSINNIYGSKELYDGLQDQELQQEVTKFDQRLERVKTALKPFEYTMRTA